MSSLIFQFLSFWSRVCAALSPKSGSNKPRAMISSGAKLLHFERFTVSLSFVQVDNKGERKEEMGKKEHKADVRIKAGQNIL